MKRLIFKNSVWQALIFAVAMLSTLILYAIIGRVFGVAPLGEVVFWLTVFRLGFSLGDFGVSTVLKRDLLPGISKENQNKYSAAVSLKILESIGVLVVLVILRWLNVVSEYNLDLGIVIFLLVAVRNMSELGYSSFIARNNFQVPLVVILFIEILSIFSVIVVAYLQGSVMIIFLLNVLISLVGFIVTSRLVNKELGLLFVWASSFSDAIRFVKRASSVGFGAAFNMLAFKADTLLLGIMVSPSAVGLYNSAYSLVTSTRIVGSSVANGSLPVLSSTFSENVKDFKRVTTHMFLVSLSLGILLSVFLWISGPLLLELVFGREFLPAEGVLLVLTVSIPFAFFNMGVWIASVAAHADKESLKIILISSAINLLLNASLIPYYSYYGAAWATLLTEIFLSVLYMRLVIRWVRQ